MRYDLAPRTGLFFDARLKDSTPFPRVADLVDFSFLVPDALHGFLLVASDPNRVTYFDDDSEAMDQTNWPVIIALPLDDDLAEVNDYDIIPSIGYTFDDDEVATAFRAGACLLWSTYETFLLVDPNRDDLVDYCVSTRSAVEDYPLLDESSYSDREYAAWLDYVDGGLQHDTIRDLEDYVDEDTVAAVEDAWDDLAPAAGDHLNSYSGFTGAHSPPFVECVALAVSTALVTVARL